MGIIEKIFSFIGDLLGKLFALLKKVLPVLLLCLAAYLSFGGMGLAAGTKFAMATGLALSGTSGALLAAGASALFFPDETAAIVSHVAGVVGTAVGSVVSAGVGVVTTGISAFLSSPAGLLLLGVGAYMLFGRRTEKEKKEAPVKLPDEPFWSVNDGPPPVKGKTNALASP